jgi:hypothetical protein
MIERNSHFQFNWLFSRITVVQSHDEKVEPTPSFVFSLFIFGD